MMRGLFVLSCAVPLALGEPIAPVGYQYGIPANMSPEEQDKWDQGQAEARKDLIAAKAALESAARANEATTKANSLIRY